MAQSAQAILIREHGGPEVLVPARISVEDPGPQEVLIRQEACGVNFIDVYHRKGLYPLPLPHGIGLEAAGTVQAIGREVTGLGPGDRVAYVTTEPGAYAEVRVVPSSLVCRLPDDVPFTTAASVMVQGMTVELLFRRIVPIAPGDTVLFHAAAGGVGLLACQWAKSEGITLIGTAGSDEKCELARSHGASHMINYKSADFVTALRDLTDGQGVDVVMDGVGKETFFGSLDCLRPLGTMISFGNASGLVPPLDIMELAKRGSLKLTRPILLKHITDRGILDGMTANLFEKLTSGALKPSVGLSLPLARATEAHRALEARETTGATILTC